MAGDAEQLAGGRLPAVGENLRKALDAVLLHCACIGTTQGFPEPLFGRPCTHHRHRHRVGTGHQTRGEPCRNRMWRPFEAHTASSTAATPAECWSGSTLRW